MGKPSRLSPPSNPALDYPEACQRFETLAAAEPADLSPVSRAVLMCHGHKTERAIVLLHGYTSSPWMYRDLARKLFDEGMNVYIPRAPRHGLADRLSPAHAGLSSAELVAWAADAIDLAHGLGAKVGLAGFSMGGAMAFWAARFRHDLDLAVIISPAIAYSFVPAFLTGWFARVLAWMPNRFQWWDEELKEEGFPLNHGYPRYATHALAAFTAIGHAVWRQSWNHPPSARQVRFLVNHNERMLDNRRTLAVCRNWQVLSGERTRLHEFEKELGLPHDYIDPDQPRRKPEVSDEALLAQLAWGW